MKVVVPKPPAGAFNKNRRISDLVQWQVRHVHEAEMRLPHHQRSGMDLAEIKTEAQASEYIRRVTARLHGRRVAVPAPPKTAFHGHRKLSSLLRSQVEHFHEAEMQLPPEQRTGIDIATVDTEYEAADYIARMTQILHMVSGETTAPQMPAAEADASSELAKAAVTNHTPKAPAAKKKAAAKRSAAKKKGSKRK
jgi:hypothetical protein